MKKIAKSFFEENSKMIFSVLIIFAMIFVFIFFFWNKTLDTPGIETECVDVHGTRTLTFDACYNLELNTIFLNSRRSEYDTYNLNSLKVSFLDSEEREYDLLDYPEKGESKVYILDATKNPRNMYIKLDVIKDFEEPICDVPKRIFVKDCRSTDPLGQEGGTPEEQIEKTDLSSHLVELNAKEEAWKASCSSTWECSGWEECKGGIQRRACEDASNCFIPTDVPDTVRYCSETCLEKWSCTWSDCLDGMTTPGCFDENNCGTEFNKPSPISCDFEERCDPQIECSDWSECKTDYSLIDAQSAQISELPGKTNRICIDKNSCVGAVRQVKSCSTGVDIYTQRFSKCGSSYVDVHNKLDGSLVARLEVGTEEDPRLNVRLDAGGEIYCDYCYNGILDGDEEEIDCGGSCGSCAGKDGPISLGSQTFFGKIISWVKGLF